MNRVLRLVSIILAKRTTDLLCGREPLPSVRPSVPSFWTPAAKVVEHDECRAIWLTRNECACVDRLLMLKENHLAEEKRALNQAADFGFLFSAFYNFQSTNKFNREGCVMLFWVWGCVERVSIYWIFVVTGQQHCLLWESYKRDSGFAACVEVFSNATEVLTLLNYLKCLKSSLQHRTANSFVRLYNLCPGSIQTSLFLRMPAASSYSYPTLYVVHGRA